MLTKDDEGGRGVSQTMTIAEGGGGGGKPNADDCWRGEVKSEKNYLKRVYKCQRCV